MTDYPANENLGREAQTVRKVAETSNDTRGGSREFQQGHPSHMETGTTDGLWDEVRVTPPQSVIMGRGDPPLTQVQDVSNHRRQTISEVMNVLSEAQQKGLPKHVAEETLLAISISLFVGSMGREAAAGLLEQLPDKVREGSFGE